MTDRIRQADQIDIELFFGNPFVPPPSDLALEALARMQAMDAEPLAQRFRDKWLDGQRITSYGEQVDWLESREGEAAIGDLEALVEDLAVRYAWERADAKVFILRGEAPTLPLWRVSALRREPSDKTNPATSTWTNEIVLRVRPQATKRQVGEAYEALRRVMLIDNGMEPGERNRSTSAPRTRDLAVLGYRIWRGDFPTWRAAFEAYRDEHPGDASLYVSPSTGRPQLKTFTRDTKNAYQRVTGLDLIPKAGMAQAEGGETRGNS